MPISYTVKSAYKELIGTMKIIMFFITGVPTKRIGNQFLGKNWGMKISSYNWKFLKVDFTLGLLKIKTNKYINYLNFLVEHKC